MQDIVSPEVGMMNQFALSHYGEYCGRVLAKHILSCRGQLFSGYIGKGGGFAKAISKLGKAYADQTEKDYNKFMKAIKAGKLIAEENPR
ncbi:MAG TPA: DUF2252 family protein [Puia sp.]|nr:DUF2252 family protein [Puia sp.]